MTPLHDLAGGVAHPSPQREAVALWQLLTALLLAPASFSTQVLVDYVIAAASCTLGHRPAPVLIAITAATFVGALVGFVMSIMLWRRVRGEKGGGRGRAAEVGEGRTRFIVLCALVSSTTFALASLLDVTNVLILGQCASLPPAP